MSGTFKELKNCKSFKEIYEVLPDRFYEIGSAVMIVLMLLMIVVETITRYLTRHQSHESMVNYFNYIGYVIICYATVIVLIKMRGVGRDGIRDYFLQNKQDILLIIFLIYALVATLLSDYRETAIWGDWFRNSGFRTYLIYASVYICGKNIKYNNKNKISKLKKNIYAAFMITCTVQNALFITKYMGYFGSLTGAFYNTNHSAYFMVIAILATVGFIAIEQNIVLKCIGTVLYIVNVSCLILNNSFGGYLAVIAAFVFGLIISIIAVKRIKPELITCIVLFVFISIIIDYKTNIVSLNFGVTANDVVKISNGAEDMGSAGTGRMELWIDTVTYIKKHPIIGSGPDSLTNVMIDDNRNVLSGAGFEDVGERLQEPHNEYLQYAAEVGTPAALVYIAALILILIKRVKDIRDTEKSVIYDGMAVLGYCVSSLFGVVVFHTAVFYFIFLGMVSASRNCTK